VLASCENTPPLRANRTPWAGSNESPATGGSGAGPSEPGSGGAADAPPAPAAVGPAQPRVIAIGDLHSDIGSTRKAFQLAGATDENDDWIGG